MISYDKFKDIFNKIEGEPEITIKYNNNEEYMLIKLDNKITCKKIKEKIKDIYFESIDNTNIKDRWNEIEDIIIDDIFSIKYDLDDIYDIYRRKWLYDI